MQFYVQRYQSSLVYFSLVVIKSFFVTGKVHRAIVVFIGSTVAAAAYFCDKRVFITNFFFLCMFVHFPLATFKSTVFFSFFSRARSHGVRGIYKCLLMNLLKPRKDILVIAL